jgi:hypothetical protein
VPVAKLIDEADGRIQPSYKFIVLGDTGEGDKSQYGLLPLIRALNPDFMIINGDVAYPAGDIEDFRAGFFQPYENLGIPIWATPGNHEYYSAQRGTEFYQTFCTYTFARAWSRHGLRLVPQPGMFWEIADEPAKLVILGLDSGMKGDLDGTNQKRADNDQHGWLSARLAFAEKQGYHAIVLFHIPGLVNGQHDKNTHLDRLHQTIGSSSRVRLVVTGHEHSFQSYLPGEFMKYVYRGAEQPPPGKAFPHYIVNGGGGAYMASTAWSAKPNLPFSCKTVCPKDWEAYVTRARTEQARARANAPEPATVRQRLTQWRRRASEWMVDRAYGALRGVRSNLSAIDQGVESAAEALSEDADIPDMMSFLLVEVKGRPGAPRTRVTPIFQQDFSSLFAVPDGTRINVQAGRPAPDPKRVADCRQRGDIISW